MPKVHRTSNVKVVPVPGGKNSSASSEGNRGNRVTGQVRGMSVVAELVAFIRRYIALPETELWVIAAWIIASWLIDKFDRFPHLAITSPEKRCGKTRLLQTIERVVPRPFNTANISPAALYRLVESKRPTLLLDEAQSIVRRASEASEVIREVLNAGIDRNAKILRCGGANMDELREFAIYSPKVVALIGELDGVLADRCIPIRLKRKTDADEVEPYRSRLVEPIGAALSQRIEEWATSNADRVADAYDAMETFPIQNDRMAELLLPLQSVLLIADASKLQILEQYVVSLEAAEAERESDGVRLLRASREIFGDKHQFIATEELIKQLAERNEEPWHRWSRGKTISPEALAGLLKPFGVKPGRLQKKVKGIVEGPRGYFRSMFQEAWSRYLAAPPK